MRNSNRELKRTKYFFLKTFWKFEFSLFFLPLRSRSSSRSIILYHCTLSLPLKAVQLVKHIAHKMQKPAVVHLALLRIAAVCYRTKDIWKWGPKNGRRLSTILGCFKLLQDLQDFFLKIPNPALEVTVSDSSEHCRNLKNSAGIKPQLLLIVRGRYSARPKVFMRIERNSL